MKCNKCNGTGKLGIPLEEYSRFTPYPTCNNCEGTGEIDPPKEHKRKYRLTNEELFRDNIKKLIRNLLVKNVNYTNGYYPYPHTGEQDIKKDTIERANYILEEIDRTEHLIVYNEDDESCKQQFVKMAPSGLSEEMYANMEESFLWGCRYSGLIKY
jgi:hypothetical protein